MGRLRQQPGGVLMTATVRPLRGEWDSRIRPLPIPASEKQIRAAYAQGVDDGERQGHVRGWRTGLGFGLLYGTVMGAAAIVAALHLGLLVGGA
jgi:hypothetical protein